MSRLVVEHVCKEYPTRSEPLIVLRDVSFSVEGGDSLAILGPSGSGKSTLLHIVGTLDRPTSGEMQLDGSSPFELDEPRLARFRNEKIGFVFQDHHLLPQLSVQENVLLPVLAQSAATSADIDRARLLMDRVGMSARVDHRPAELSGGERQRVAVCRALMCKPCLVLADEPTGNLDQANAEMIAELLLRMQVEQGDQPSILVVVTHSQPIAEKMNRQLHLRDGACS